MLQRLTTAILFLVLILFVSMLGVNEASAGPSPPDTFTTSDVTRTSWTVSWSGGPGFTWTVIGYSFRSRVKGTTDWTYVDGAPFTNTSLTFTGSANTTYEYQVQTLAQNEGALLINWDNRKWSSWSTAQEVTTKANQAPMQRGTIGPRTLKVGSSLTMKVSDYFSDADDPDSSLVYTIAVDNANSGSQVTSSLSDRDLTVNAGDAPGTATIDITVKDTYDATATQSFKVTVEPYYDPVPVGTILNYTLKVGGTGVGYSGVFVLSDVSSYFVHPDGDTMTYSATLSDTSIGTVAWSGTTLSITAVAEGSTTVTVTATDSRDATGVHTFSLTVLPNSAPTTVDTIPTQTVSLTGSAGTVDLSSYFSDPDGNPLTYTATSSNISIATVSLSGATLTITAVAAGWTTITVNVTDNSNAAAQQSFSVSVVSNRSPISVEPIPNQTVRVGETAGTVDLSSYFSDPDGNPLTYSATSSNTSKATVSVSDATLTITAVAAGSATITVTATDPSNASRSRSFSATVLASHTVNRVGTIPNQTLFLSGTDTATIDVSGYFSGPVDDTLTYSATSSNTSKATVSLSDATLTITGVAAGSSTIRVTATSSENASATQSFSATVYSNRAPTIVATIPAMSIINSGSDAVYLVNYFSDPDGNTLTYTASSSNATLVEVSIGGVDNSTLTIWANGLATATITVTATDPSSASATQSFSVEVIAQAADALPGLSSDELSQLEALVTYDPLIINELYNGSDDANDWLEFRNMRAAPLPLDDWKLSLLMGGGNVVVAFPTGTVIPGGGVLLLTNTAIRGTSKASVSSVAVETFALPQKEFALILQGPSGIGDLAVNYFQAESESTSEMAPFLTVDTVWQRNQPVVSGYLAEAWSSSTQATPGYRHLTERADLNNDGAIGILDLVLVASQFGMDATPTADLNADGIVNIQDLVVVANAVNDVAAAPTAQQSQAAIVNNWLQLARQNASSVIATSIPEGFSYERGIFTLEQLVRALVPESTALLANYPNPFNPETWIPYQLSKASEVTVTLYASDGSVVRTLALGHQDAGTYHNRTQAAYWDGRNMFGETVASGVYFYTLTAGEFAATRKMLILK